MEKMGDNEDEQITISYQGHVWTIHDVRTNYHDRGLNDNIVALFSGFYSTVARRKSTQWS